MFLCVDSSASIVIFVHFPEKKSTFFCTLSHHSS
jgi:hypothetical protein